MINVLVTTAGGNSGVNCITALREQSELGIRIFASDFDKYASGLFLADKYYLVPSFMSEVNYLDAIVNICRKENIDVVLPTFSTDVYLFSKHESELKNSGVNFFSSNINTVSLFRDKWQSHLFFQKYGIHSPKTFELSTLVDPFFPLLLKPKIGSGSKNIIKTDSLRDLDYYRQKVDTTQYIAQEIVLSPEYTVDILVGNNNELLSLVARQRIKTKDGIAIVSRTVDSSLIAPVIEKILRNIEFRGPINFQYFHVEGQGTLIFDFNTRFAAGGLPLSIKAGINTPLETIKLALGLPTKKLERYAVGLTMIRYYTTFFTKDT